MAHEVIAIDVLLAELGYAEPSASQEARRAIEAAGLTNPRKRNILLSKREAVESALSERLALVCADTRCLRLAAADTRPHVRVQRSACQFCGGRPTPTAVREMAAVLVNNGRPKLLVVGGSPQAHAELRRLLARAPVDLRLVEGTVAVNEKRADAWAAWADVIAVWGGTQLDHRVSEHFLDPNLNSIRVTLVQRGIAALADAVVEHVNGHRRE